MKRINSQELKIVMPLIRSGSNDARNKLVENNFGLLFATAQRFKNKGVDLEDLIQEGFLGLIRATESFNESLGFAFSTYATHWIEQKIRMAIWKNSMIRNPIGSKKTGRRINTRNPEDDETDDLLTFFSSSELLPDMKVMAEDMLIREISNLKLIFESLEARKKDIEIFTEKYDLNGFFEIKSSKKLAKKFKISVEKLKYTLKKISKIVKIESKNKISMEAVTWFEKKVVSLNILQHSCEKILNLGSFK